MSGVSIHLSLNMGNKKTPCSKCQKNTLSLRGGRAYYTCEECGHNKSLSDYMLWEATHKN